MLVGPEMWFDFAVFRGYYEYWGDWKLRLFVSVLLLVPDPQHDQKVCFYLNKLWSIKSMQNFKLSWGMVLRMG